eukprot:TRINITY_DN2126_c0_g1_i6.p2 TRINITY_DN2126_c0_g1~~TRINITY_DN2126_c0_g1_i6.p2  ORF type:complete len:161 (+),score=32.50 TRINITY_DN2126_c0_g1_i6:194-676(+)
MCIRDRVSTQSTWDTLGGAYVEKNVELQNGETIKLSIWDTAGDERYRSLTPLYYRDAAVAVLVYDVSDMNSFKDLNYWIQELSTKVKADNMIISLIGNKNDIEVNEKKVTTQTAETFAKDNNLLFQECSAKTGLGIEEAFEQIIQHYLQIQNQNKISKIR